jgi:U-box domain
MSTTSPSSTTKSIANTTKTSQCHNKWSIGEDLVCPITLQLFLDPVFAEDGYLYEREAIQMHFQVNGNRSITSPLTRAEIGTKLTDAPQIRNHMEGLVEHGYIRGDDATLWKQRQQEKQQKDQLTKKAHEGDVEAMLEMATNYYNAESGFEENNELAFYWFDAARRAGNVIGMTEAGNLLTCGVGVEPNVPQGMLYIGTAAGLGSRVAAFYLGFALADGKFGLPVDEKDAIHWLNQCLSDKVACPGDYGITEDGKRKARLRLEQLKKRTTSGANARDVIDLLSDDESHSFDC